MPNGTPDAGYDIVVDYDGDDVYHFADLVVNGSTIDALTHINSAASVWTFFGVAAGGTIDFDVNGISLQVITIAGQTTAVVAINVATAINSNATLSVMGVTAFPFGGTVTTNGTFSNKVINDPGLTDIARIPALSVRGFMLFLLLTGAGFLIWRRRRELRS